MNVGPLGMIGSAAGSPLAQTKGSEADRAQQDATNHARRVKGETAAENAEGIGETEQDEQASDRDADGRRLWGEGMPHQGEEEPQEDDSASEANADQPKSRDATGSRGNQLDLSG